MKRNLKTVEGLASIKSAIVIGPCVSDAVGLGSLALLLDSDDDPVLADVTAVIARGTPSLVLLVGLRPVPQLPS